MAEINIPPFYIGQEVVGNCNHRQIKKGKDYIVSDVSQCSCGLWKVEVGLPIPSPYIGSHCSKCGWKSLGRCWYQASRFSPKIEITAFLSMKEVANVELFAAN